MHSNQSARADSTPERTLTWVRRASVKNIGVVAREALHHVSAIVVSVTLFILQNAHQCDARMSPLHAGCSGSRQPHAPG